METVVANLSAKARREKLHGRDYLVAPMTLIVPGVLNGSKGPILYELSDIKEQASAWNGIPIHINHPSTSGRDPSILNDSGVGWVFKADISNDKLTAEGWFDVERLQSLHPQILNALLKGDKVDVSTGLGVEIEAVSGVDNLGRQYQGIARKHRPDHLAILPDTSGACSLEDGCGVNNNFKDSEMKLSTEQRTKLVDEIVKNCKCWQGDEDRKTLEAMNDKALNHLHESIEKDKKLKEQEEVLNAAREGFKAGNVTVILNEKGEWVHNAEEEEEKEEKEEEVTNKSKPIELKDLPVEVQNQIAYGARRMQDDKDKLINKLVANAKHLTEDQQETYRKFLINESNTPDGIQKLETLAMALPTEDVENGGQGNQPIYLSPVLNRSGKQYKPEPLGLPNWDFSSTK